MTPKAAYRVVAAALCAAALVAAGSARADVPKGVQAKLKGQILVSDEELPDGLGSEAETLKVYKKLALAEVVGDVREDVAYWQFFITAFLAKAPNVSDLSLDFYRIDGKKRLYVANVGMSIDPKLTIVTSPIQISEDDNVTRGTTYEVVLSAQVGSKEMRFAKTIVTLKAGAPPKKPK